MSRLYLIILLSLGCLISSAQNTLYKGGIVRASQKHKTLTLVFTGADKADGAEPVLNTLRRHKVPAVFFLTGAFVERYPQHIRRMKSEGHYIGSHSWAHPLYSTWENPDSTIITKEAFRNDIITSYEHMAPFGINRKTAKYFMPPYEHYNQQISDWTAEMGLTLVNYTPGSTSNADYTTPEMKNYRSSEEIYQNILNLEEREGLNGHLMLFHIGTVDARTDKFYARHLDKLIVELKRRGYKFVTLKKLLQY